MKRYSGIPEKQNTATRATNAGASRTRADLKVLSQASWALLLQHWVWSPGMDPFFARTLFLLSFSAKHGTCDEGE